MPPGFDLLIISDGEPELLERLARALADVAPGRVAILLREPQLRTRELCALGQAVRALTSERGVRLLVSDRVDVALAIDADGVHLPEAGLPIEVARYLLRARPLPALIGVSRHDAQGLARAASEGADYATLSPVHAVPGKGAPLGIAGFAAIAAHVQLPVFALGGVRVRDVPALRSAGARGVAVVREVLAAGDPRERTRALLAAL